MNRKLGKQPVRGQNLIPKLGSYFGTAQPGAIEVLPAHGWVAPSDWTEKVPAGGWPILLNDVLGCCTIAAVGHVIQALTSYTRLTPAIMSPAEVVAGYSRFGYNPDDPSTDKGAVVVDVLQSWMNDGFMAGGQLHKIAGMVQIDPMNMTELKYGIQRFGNIIIGVELPISAQTQSEFIITDPSLTGDAAVGSWGGHCLPGLRSNPDAVGTVTWGALMDMDWEFLQTYVSEVYAVFDSQDQLLNGLDRDGFRVDQLVADLNRMRQGMQVG